MQVDEAERKRDEEMRRKGGAAMSQKNLDKGFKELIARARQAKVQKEGGLPQAPEQAREAGQGEEGEVGKMMSLPRAGDGGPPRPAEETADAAEQSSVCLEDGSSLSDASTVSPPPRAGDRDDLDGEEGGGGQTVVVALDAEESRASADEVQVVGTCPPPTTESAAFTSLSAAQPPPLAPPLQSASMHAASQFTCTDLLTHLVVCTLLLPAPARPSTGGPEARVGWTREHVWGPQAAAVFI